MKAENWLTVILTATFIYFAVVFGIVVADILSGY